MSEPRPPVIFRNLDDGLWRASLEGADHVGGCGPTPEEALGWLCLRNPQRMGIGEFRWEDRPPNSEVPPVVEYPEGVVEPFEDGDEEPEPPRSRDRPAWFQGAVCPACDGHEVTQVGDGGDYHCGECGNDWAAQPDASPAPLDIPALFEASWATHEPAYRRLAECEREGRDEWERAARAAGLRPFRWLDGVRWLRWSGGAGGGADETKDEDKSC